MGKAEMVGTTGLGGGATKVPAFSPSSVQFPEQMLTPSLILEAYEGTGGCLINQFNQPYVLWM